MFSLVYSQDYDFSKSIKLNNKTPRFKILGKNINYIIAERWGTKFHYIDLYNSKLKKVSSKELNFEKDEHIKKIWIQPKKGWVLYLKAKKDKTFVLAKKLDSKFNIKSKTLILDSIQERKDLVQENFRNKFSLNEQFLCTYLPVFSKGRIDFFKINIFDTELNKVQKVELKDEFIKQGKYVSLLPMNNGAFVLVYKEKESTNKFKIFYKTPTGNLIKHIIQIDNEIYKKLKIEIDNINNELIFSGFRLYKGNKKNVSDAFFTLKVNLETGKKSSKLLNVFTKEFYKLITGKEPKNEKVTLQTFGVKKIIAKQDGGFLVFAESFYENIETTSVPYMSTITRGTSVFEQNTYKTKSFNYNDIIVYSISKNLKLENVNIINKRQQSYDDKGGYSSFFIVNRQDELNILFLDEINTESSLKNYILDSDSKLKKNYIFNVSQNNVMPVVKMAIQISPNEVLIPSFLNNSFSIIKIVFTE